MRTRPREAEAVERDRVDAVVRVDRGCGARAPEKRSVISEAPSGGTQVGLKIFLGDAFAAMSLILSL